MPPADKNVPMFTDVCKTAIHRYGGRPEDFRVALTGTFTEHYLSLTVWQDLDLDGWFIGSAKADNNISEAMMFLLKKIVGGGEEVIQLQSIRTQRRSNSDSFLKGGKERECSSDTIPTKAARQEGNSKQRWTKWSRAHNSSE